MPRLKSSKKFQEKIPLQITRNGSQNPSAEELLNSLIKKAVRDYETNPESKKETENIAFSFTGTLPDWAIKEHIKEGLIKIDPLPEDWEELIDEVTIDFHLGNKLRVFTTDGLNTIDLKHTSKEEMESMMRYIELKPGQPFILTENDFVIATTKEKLTIPDNIIGHLHGKSSLARLGIVVHSTAARFDPGWDGYPVLEFGTFLKGKKIIIYEGAPICAFSFEKLAHPVERSYKFSPNNRYGNSDTPMVSNITGKNVTNLVNTRRRRE